MSSAKALGLVLSCTTLLAFGIVAYPHAHNQLIHPLGQIDKSISVGDDCEAVRRTLADYMATPGPQDRQANENVMQRRPESVERGPQTYELFVYDLSLFDDLQLRVVCSYASETVVYKLFLAD